MEDWPEPKGFFRKANSLTAPGANEQISVNIRGKFAAGKGMQTGIEKMLVYSYLLCEET